MDKRKIKTPSVLKTEAEEVLALVKELVKNGKVCVESEDEKIELGKALARDLQSLPMVGFSHKELYVILRFLVLLNRGCARMAHYVHDEDEEYMCDVLAAGIVSELESRAAAEMGDVFEGMEITITGGGC